MDQDPGSLKQFLSERWKEIAARHRAGGGGFATASALSGAMDEALRIAYNSLPADRAAHIALLALGGYGRAELFPKSDVDVMVVCRAGADTQIAGEAAKQLLHMLWDTGLDIGHSVRSIDEAIALHGKTLDSWASMIESRYLCGDESLAKELFRRLAEKSTAKKDAWFIQGVFADIYSRHVRFGSSVKLLEPNVKKSAGGLRDVHALYWLYRDTDTRYIVTYDPARPALAQFFDLLLKNGELDADEHADAHKALEFVFRVRQEMHYHQDAIQDTLGYALQISVAESMGYGSIAQLRSVEVFMRDYYRHTRILHRLSVQLGQHFREIIEPVSHSRFTRKKVDDLFYLHDETLYLEKYVRRFDEPGPITQAFTIAAERGVSLDFRLRGTIERSLDLITEEEQSSAGVSLMIRKIFTSRRVADTLHDMNSLGVLSRCIPEWAELVAFFQHNVYHYYTADEHTLIAVGNAEALRDKIGILHDVHRTLRRKDLLYIALLLHDIAKPHGVADHEITGIEMSRTVLHRLGMDDIFPDVSFLVRHHLVMEQIAFRRNIYDPVTIKDFAERFPRAELLDYLFVLTYADLSAVNTGVWTEWKSTMLQELYRRTSEVLSRNLKGTEVDQFHEAQRNEAVGNVIQALTGTIPRETIEKHLRGMQNPSYLALFTEEDIGKHIQLSASVETVSTSYSHGDGFTEVTVVARDAPFALSKFCAVLSANDANIFDANIFTRDDGVIIDRFRVTDASSRSRLEGRVCEKISNDLVQVMDGRLDLDHLFAEHKRKWKRRAKKPANPNIRTDVAFEDNPQYTIIDVYGPDRVGALYKITETISRLGLDIYFAKIATRVDGIVDAFYTLDRSGRPLKGHLRTAIRTEILNTVNELAEEELG